MKIKGIKAAIVYSTLVLGLTLLANVTKIYLLIGLVQLSPMLVLGLMLLFFSERKATIRSTGIGKLGNWKWYILAGVSGLPILISFLVAWGIGYIALPTAAFLNTGAAHFTVFEYVGYMTKAFWSPAMLISMGIFAFGEEIGWRGYLQPKLTETYGSKRAILGTSIVWALFHYPFYLNGYNEDGNFIVTILLFTIMIFPLSVFIGWFRFTSGSIWPAVLSHTMINLTRSWLEQLFTTKAEGWTYIAGESGMVTIILWGFWPGSSGAVCREQQHALPCNHASWCGI
ncbi:CPBP family intramembrane glutamic endopeptidase [Brevibacillus laterosporus]|uniref:CPBP family intramembrane glutamic endopeptidase n=1 Tax=Brevibacillus laterosporus TaxID=1465 RepID=UPI00240518CD|nr:type II CAAX endopeptidase family protein [Brevibacillus laterosporus]